MSIDHFLGPICFTPVILEVFLSTYIVIITFTRKKLSVLVYFQLTNTLYTSDYGIG